MARKLHVKTDGNTETIRDNVAESTSGEASCDRAWSSTDLGKDVHVAVVEYVNLLMRQADTDHNRNRARERIYEGTDLINNRAAIISLEAAGIGIAKLNATKSIIDTFVSRLAKDRPMPNFDVDGEDWYLKRKAKKFRQFIVGSMLGTEFDDLSREALLDGGICGNGYTRIDATEEEVFAERIPINEIVYDKRECRYGKPSQAARVYRIAKDQLAELYPDQEARIRDANASERRKDDDFDMLSDLDDYTDVYEVWDLPSSKTSERGRHALCISTATLCYERWYEPRFPWAHMRLFKPRNGLMGTGFVDQLAPIQHRVNCIVRDIQLNIAATGRGHFLVNANNDIPTELLTGFQPFKLKYNGGTPPTYVAPQPFSPAQMQALQFFIAQMYELSGVSQAAATSKSSLGAGASGIALDTQYDIDSDRFRMPQSNYARYRLDGGQRYLDASARCARRRAEKGKKTWVASSWVHRDAIEKLEYSEVELKDGEYKLNIEAVNFLPDTRAGKLAVVEQLAKAGVIEQWLVPTLFDDPDLIQANGILLAAFKNAMRKMDELANEKLPIPVPEPMNDLSLELKLVVAYYNRVQEEKAPLIVQDRYYQYEAMVRELIKLKTSQSQVDGSVGPGGPMAPETAPAEGPLPGGVPQLPVGSVPQPAMVGAQPGALAPPVM